MNRKIVVASAVALLGSSSVCADVMPEREKLASAARFVELEKVSEAEVQADPSPGTYKLLPLCTAYGKLKRYGKLFPCLERLAARIATGDIALRNTEEHRKISPFLMANPGRGFKGGLAEFEQTAVPFLHILYAEAYNELGDYAKALEHAKRAHETAPRGWASEPWYQINTLVPLALAHAFAGNKDEAARIAARIETENIGGDNFLLAKERNASLARIHSALGNFAEAKRLLADEGGGIMYSLAKSLAGSVGGLDAGDSIFAYFEVPSSFLRHKAQFETGDLKAAREGFDRLLADPRVRGNGEILWLLLYDRGRLAAADGDMAAAVRYWREAVELIEQQRSTISTEANKIGFVGDKQAVYRQLIGALFAAGDFAGAFDYLERSKSRALVDMLAAKQDFAVAGPGEDKVRTLLAQAQTAERDNLAQAAGARQRGLPTDAVREIATQAPELASLIAVAATPLDTIRAGLGADEALVEYYYDERHLYAFVLTRETLAGVRSELGALETEVRQWRAALHDADSPAHLEVARRLHARLIAPLAPLLDKPRLALVPHGVLHYAPLAALHDGQAYLLDRYALRLLPAASVLKYLKAPPPGRTTGVLAFGNPDLGDPRLDLRHAQDEAVAIARMIPDSKALLRAAANEAALREFGGGFRYLHFATHGEFKAEAPLQSALYLSKDGDASGRLTVGKLYSTRLAADLVTLSACETGLGKIASGDDVVGMTRGFLYAGAATVVSSLWKVDDQATADLMRLFYKNLAGGNKQDALRRAQLAAREKYPHPYFWAAFQLVGQPSGEGYTPVVEPPPAPAATAVAAPPAERAKPGKARKPSAAPVR